MEEFIAAFSAGVDAVDSFVWGWAMIVLLLGTHLYTTIRTKFIQRKIGTAIKLSISKSDSGAEGDVSQFGALTTALAATTTATTNVVATQQADATQAPEAAEDGAQKQGLGKQIRKILIFGVIVGIIAVGYGLTTMRYNAEKMDDMTEESRKIVERLRDDNE